MFTSYDSIIAALSAGYGQDLLYNKVTITSVAANWYTLWYTNGSPGAGTAPSGVANSAVCDSSTTGAMSYGNANGGRQMSLLSFGGGGQTLNNLILYDRLWHCGGLPFVTSTQTFTGATAPTRYTNGVGNGLFIEITTASGGGGNTLSVSYTNQDGVPGRTASVVVTASSPINRVQFLTLESGDTGIQSVQSYSCANTPAGAFTLVMYNQSMFNILPYPAGGYTERDMVLQVAQLPTLPDSSCLALMMFASTTSTGYVFGKVKIAEG
ncbi:MAG TPA: hypothetical protein PKA10_19755 [Selenomonadales bacterium]|nr:hypothetical protein [Selenomonadales bacterium]